MLQYKKFAEEGDTVLIYLDIKSMYPVVLKKNQIFQTMYGALKLDDVIGSEYGTRVSCSRGWVYVLFMTPELWTVSLPHRTQILYTPDISLIILQLDLKPGSVVCEAGTGSGSLSHAIARTISPTGFLHTFDFHEKRVDIAYKEFISHGLQNVVNVQHQDVSREGFGLPPSTADAVFLDLPRPWDVIPFSVKAIRPGGRLCSFSPCIEQVQRTCESLCKHGFQDITTMECLQRKFDVKKQCLPILKMPDEVPYALAGHMCTTEEMTVDSPDSEVKMVKVDENMCQVTPDATAAGCSGAGEDKMIIDSSNYNKKVLHDKNKASSTENHSFWAVLPQHQMATHTGYLTFATFSFYVK